MDDFGVLCTAPTGTPVEEPVAGHVKDQAVSRFKQLGVVPHKLTLGEGLDMTLGVWIDDDRRLRVAEDKWWELVSATEWAVEHP